MARSKVTKPSNEGVESLISACVRVIARSGITGVTHRSIAAESGTSNGLVTHHFGSIGGLIQATLEHVGVSNVADHNAYFEKIRSAKSIDEIADILARNAERRMVLNRDNGLVTLELQLAATRDAAMQVIFLEHSRNYVRQLEGIFERSQATDPQTNGRELASLIYGLIATQLALPRKKFLNDSLKPTIYRYLSIYMKH
jgi:TetR/AcrR family transcriptional regulator, regulator of biofilm formation and stress response